MKRLKNSIRFSIIFLLILTFLNIIGIIICNEISTLYNEYTFWEYFSFGIIQSILIFLLVLIGGIRYSEIYIPITMIFFLLFLYLGMDYLNGFDLLYLIIFAFSRITYILFEIVNKVFQNKSFTIDLILLLGILFFYLFGHILLTKYLFNNKFEKFNCFKKKLMKKI